MRPDSDIDLMAVFDNVDHPTLEQVRRMQHRFEKLSLSVYSLNNIRQYPTFRRYVCSTALATSLAPSVLHRPAARQTT
ncbi:hypothetical protein [Candidatus Symbiopectobacterium sp.]|uniref:hypothetical protein n=1 Tax=Candidatus Symbiopectobacterium sp. TaxID=2816440 RepID=UPI0025C25C6E|nr:hypothetical protein [Candidatus Symbiopectobacterium sp.]